MEDRRSTRDLLIEKLNEMRRRVTKFEESLGAEAWESIENSSLRLLGMLDRSHQAYFLLREGRVEFLNRACVEMFGYSHVEWSSLPSMMEKVIHPDDREAVRKYYQDRNEPDTSCHRYVCRIICKDGSLKWLDIKSSSILWKQQPAFLALATDITQYIELQKSLEEKTLTLGERIKELNCLYQISELLQVADLSLPQILQKIVDLIPPAWQYPEITCAEIRVLNDDYKTNNHAECVFTQSERIIVDGADVGVVRVGYLEQRPERDEGPFLNEERNLIKTIARHIVQIISRKRADEESRIRDKAIRTATNGIGFAHPDGRIFFANDELLRMWRFKSQDEVIGKHISEFWVDPNSVSEGQLELLKKGCFHGERTALRADGTTFEAQVSTNSVLDDSGKVVCMMASFLDITDRKRADDELRQDEKRFRSFIESAPDAIFVQTKGCFAYVNKAAQELFGVDTPDRLLGTPVIEHFHPSDHEAIKERIRELNINKQKQLPRVQRCIRQDGSIVSAEVFGVPIRYDNQDGALVFARDLTESQRINEALRQSEERFRQVSDNAEEWIWEVDENGMYSYCSSSVERILGYSCDELVGKKYFYDFYPPEEREKIKEFALGELTLNSSFSGFITVNIRKDGVAATLESSGVAIVDQTGKMIGYRGVAKDITEKLRTEQERVRLFTAIEQAAASVLITSPAGTVEYVNPAFERITGYPMAEIIGKNPKVLQSGKHDKAF